MAEAQRYQSLAYTLDYSAKGTSRARSITEPVSLTIQYEVNMTKSNFQNCSLYLGLHDVEELPELILFLELQDTREPTYLLLLGLRDAVHMYLGLHDAVHLYLEVHDAVHMYLGLHDAVHMYIGLHDAVHIYLGMHDAVHMYLGMQDTVHMYLGLHDAVHMYLGLHDAVHMYLGLHDAVHMYLGLHDEGKLAEFTPLNIRALDPAL
jgi:hypothetical protein